jgi:hypothetical protein
MWQTKSGEQASGDSGSASGGQVPEFIAELGELADAPVQVSGSVLD